MVAKRWNRKCRLERAERVLETLSNSVRVDLNPFVAGRGKDSDSEWSNSHSGARTQGMLDIRYSLLEKWREHEGYGDRPAPAPASATTTGK